MAYAFLTMTTGSRVGASFVLDPTDDSTVGRGTECSIVLNDPLCSRVHAVLSQSEQGWVLRDSDSRNGTFVNGQRVSQNTVLNEGAVIKVGSTEFRFQQADQPPTVGVGLEPGGTQIINRDMPVNINDTGSFAVDAVRNDRGAQDIVALFELSVRLLEAQTPDDVARATVEVLRDRTRATVVGFLWASDDGELKPKVVIPPSATKRVKLSETLTRLVTQKGRALWVSDQQKMLPNTATTIQHFADAICVPLVYHEQTLGAVHIYLERGRFQQTDFEFAMSLANVAVLALVKARRQASLQTDFNRMVDKWPGYNEIIGDSAPIVDLKYRVGRLARATGCVLIRGESGCGKELVARAIHKASPRADRPLLCVNCAALPKDLMESQLFGHKAGSFTGADRDHQGFFQQADSGSLFLDEVGELSLDGQAKLLRILEGHPFRMVGGTEELSVDVRVIAATNQDLQAYVREKRFREDLYYRLSVFELLIPSLRERGKDVGLLIDYFLDHFRKQHGRPELKLSFEGRQMLEEYRWPGNVRQLRNVIDSAVVLANDPEILPSDLYLRSAGDEEIEDLRFDFWEQKLIREALKRADGNVPDAAKLLGIGRATLYRKLEEYNIAR